MALPILLCLAGPAEAKDPGEADSPPRLVVVGIDGASWGFLDPLLDRGDLPNLARIRREGSICTMRSIPCYVSPPAWTTMFSGCLPAKTGVYTYGRWDRSRREFTSVNADDVRVPRVWDVASHDGGRVGLFNVPMTWPPRAVNGVMVSGMMTPLDIGPAAEAGCIARRPRPDATTTPEPKSWSPVLRTANGDSLNSYLWALYDTVNDGRRDYDTVMVTVVSNPAGVAAPRSYRFPVGEYSPWIEFRSARHGSVVTARHRKAIVRTSCGRYETQCSPTYYDIPEPYTWPESFARRIGSTFEHYLPGTFVDQPLVLDFTRDATRHAEWFYDLEDWDLYAYVFTQSDNIHHLCGFSHHASDVYREIDRFIGHVMDEMGDRGNLLVVSDHGFAGYSVGIDLNVFLRELGLLSRDDEGGIDFDETLVFHNVWHLYFNHDLLSTPELQRRGIEVAAGDTPVESLNRFLRQAMSRIVSKGGKISASLKLDPVAGDIRGEAPDMIVSGTDGNCVVDFLGLGEPHSTVFHRLSGEHQWWHERDGVFMAWGEDIRRGVDAGRCDIQDVAPTMLYLLGLPISLEIDGHVLERVCKPALTDRRDPQMVSGYSTDLFDTPPVSSLREPLVEKLRSLGYVR